MAKNSQTSESFDTMVRRIVREEVASMFATFSSYDDGGEEADISGAQPTSLDTIGGRGSARNSGTPKRRGRPKVGKGRTTNPATDKRFKANREINA